jgi:hypothetical protein
LAREVVLIVGRKVVYWSQIAEVEAVILHFGIRTSRGSAIAKEVQIRS